MEEITHFYFDQRLIEAEIALSVRDRALPHQCLTLESEATTLSPTDTIQTDCGQFHFHTPRGIRIICKVVE